MATLTEAQTTLQEMVDTISAEREADKASPDKVMLTNLKRVLNIDAPDFEWTTEALDVIGSISNYVESLPTGSAGSVDKVAGNALALTLLKALDGIGAGLDVPEGFDPDGALATVEAWSALTKRTRGAGTGDNPPDADGRVVMLFTYPEGADTKMRPNAEQAVRFGSLGWEATKRAKALSNIDQGERRGYTWSAEARDAWRVFEAEVREGIDGATFDVDFPLTDGNVMGVTYTYNA